jgi:hypothetical protein
MMATLVSNSMGLFEALRGSHSGMVFKAAHRRESRAAKTNTF